MMADHMHQSIHYFVDEAGDTVLFNRKGKIRIGVEGCSNYFIMGKLEVADPEAVAHALEDLRAELLADPYFTNVPSMQPERCKTAVAFHAKDDLPEIRREVYKLLLKQDVRFYAVVRNKHDLLAYVKQRNEQDPDYCYNQNEQYDILVRELFRKFHHSAEQVAVRFAKRGRKDRTVALCRALTQAEQHFEEDFGFAHPAKHEVLSTTPKETVCLQAVDYYLWALQRFYERKEERYLDAVWDQVAEVHDLDAVEDGRRGIFYTKEKPLT